MPRNKITDDARHISLWLSILLALAVIPIALQACGDVSTPSISTPIPTAVRALGEATYIRYCNVCHPGGGLGAGPSLIGLELSDRKLRDLIRHGKGRMPGFGKSTITDEELDDLVHYIISLSK
jgi:mono/diheme cytochrome c family protein